MSARHRRVSPRLRVTMLATLIALSSFVAEAAPAIELGLGPDSPVAPLNLGPDPVQAGWCASNPEFRGRLTASSSSTTAVGAITNPTVYGYLSNVDKAWSCNIYFRYSALTWNTTGSAGTYVWGALIASSSTPCNWVINTNDYLKANSTSSCPTSISQHAMSINLNPEGVYTNDNSHNAFGQFGYAHSDCGTWYGNKVTKTGASYSTSATNNRPGSNCDPITLEGTNTSQTVTYDKTGPTGSININSGAAATNSTTVTLNLSASDNVSGVYQRRFSNDGSSWSAWEAYGTSKSWTLTSGDGTKTVYVRYRDNNLNVSATYSKSIILDTAVPTVDFTTPNEGTTTIQKTTGYSVAWTENGTGSAIASRSLQRQRGTIAPTGSCSSVSWANDGSATGGASPKSETGLANGYCYRWRLTVTDQAGNTSALRTSGSVLVDTANPTVDFTTPNENTTTILGATEYTVAWTENGTGTNIASRSLQRQRSSVTSPGQCPTGGWSNVDSAYTGTSPRNESGLADGYAYRWVQTLTDQATNTGAGTSGCLIIDTSVPSSAFVSPTDGLNHQNSTSIEVSWTEDAAGGVIASRSLQMESGIVEVSGTCDDVDWQPDGSPTSATSPVTFSNLASGSCYRWVQTLTNQASTQGVSSSGEVLVDTADPTATIAFPEEGRPLAGTITVSGTATDELSYELFTLEYGAGASPTAWTEIQADGAAVEDGELALWETKHLHGVYTLRLTVSDLAGNEESATHAVYLESSGRGGDAFRTRVPFNLGGGWQMAVGVANGELTLDRHLLEIPSFGPAQSLALSYSSLNDSSAGLFGTGWSSSLTQHLTFEDGFVVWHRADGGIVPFGLVDSAWTPLAGHHEALSHDAVNNRYTITARDQSRLVFEDAGAGRVVRIENRFGKALTLNWGSTSATATDASNRTTNIAIDSGRITGVTDSADRGWSFGYTSGNLSTITDPAGKVTSLGYSSGELTTITRTRTPAAGPPAETVTWTVGYDSGRVTSVIDPESTGPASTFEYDLGQTTVGLLKEYSPVERNTWLYNFDELGRVTAILDPEGYTTSYVWDESSNLLELVLPIDTDGAAQTITFAYDERGNVLSQTTQLTETEFVVTAMSYNATNDMLIHSEADNDASLKLVTRHTYDGAGHLTSINVNCTSLGTTPPADASTCTGAGAQDASTNLITAFSYTATDQLEHQTDPLGRVTRHVYDAYGNEIETIQNYQSGQSADHQTNVTTSFSHNSAGLVTSETDPTLPVGNTTTFTYDALGRQTSETRPGDSSSIPSLTRTTTYDELGNVLTEADAWGTDMRTTTYVYDKSNRQTLVTDPASVEAATSYDAAGNETSSAHAGVTTTRLFDGLGRVTEEYTVVAAKTRHAYDGQGRDVETVDPAGVTTTREYDLGSRLRREATQTDDGELVTTYEYDLLGRQLSSTSPDGVVAEYGYDRVGRVKSVTDADATTTHNYDRAGNQLSTTAPDETVTTTSYDSLNRPTIVVANYSDPPASPAVATENVTMTTFYDAAGRTLAFRDAEGIVSRSIYNPRGLVMKSIANCVDSSPSDPPDCNGTGAATATTNLISTYEYDGTGAIVVVVMAAGVTDVEASFEYANDAAGRPIAMRDPRGTVTRTFYDVHGRATKTILNCTDDTFNPAPPTGEWWACGGGGVASGTWNLTSLRSYDARGNLSSETAPNGRKTGYIYDEADRLVERIDNDVAGTPGPNEDLTTFYAYDSAGRQSAVMAPTEDREIFAVTRYFYNGAGQLAREIGNCLAEGVTAYGPASAAWKTCINTDAVHDAQTNLVTEYEYDERGNRVALIAPDPSAPDDQANMVVTRYAYDGSNRLCGVLQNATIELASGPCATDPGVADPPTENVWTAYAYDGLGNLAAMTDGRGSTTLYGYDASGRMVTLTDGLGNTTTWKYDELGRRVKQIRRSANPDPEDLNQVLVSWTYDAAGRMASRTAGGVTTNYSYDLLGNRISAKTGAGPTISATYDRLNRPLTVTVSGDGAATTSYSYSLTTPSWSDPSGAYTATLDAFDRQVALSDPVNGSTAWTFAYRADGLPASIGAPNGNTTTFAYDAAGHLVAKDSAAGSINRVGYGWTYNRAGQILSEAYTLGTDQPIIAEYSYDALSRLETWSRDNVVTTYGWQAVLNRDSVKVGSDPALTAAYDAANRIDDTGYDHDLEGRLTERPGQVLEWDVLGRLNEIEDSSSNTIATYTYDALDRLYTVTRDSSTIRFRYVGLTTQVAQVVDHQADADPSDDLVIRSLANDWTGTRLFDWTGTDQRHYGTNGHHDVSWTADDTGSVSATLRYDPWGNLTSSTGNSLPDHRFQGSWLDTESDLYWVVARWYAPSLGRFISEDSLLGQPEDPPSRHLYVYAGANPVYGCDPDGRAMVPLPQWIQLKNYPRLRRVSRGWRIRLDSEEMRVCRGTADYGGWGPGSGYTLVVDAHWLGLEPGRVHLYKIYTKLKVHPGPQLCPGCDRARVLRYDFEVYPSSLAGAPAHMSDTPILASFDPTTKPGRPIDASRSFLVNGIYPLSNGRSITIRSRILIGLAGLPSEKLPGSLLRWAGGVCEKHHDVILTWNQ